MFCLCALCTGRCALASPTCSRLLRPPCASACTLPPPQSGQQGQQGQGGLLSLAPLVCSCAVKRTRPPIPQAPRLFCPAPQGPPPAHAAARTAHPPALTAPPRLPAGPLPKAPAHLCRPPRPLGCPPWPACFQAPASPPALSPAQKQVCQTDPHAGPVHLVLQLPFFPVLNKACGGATDRLAYDMTPTLHLSMATPQKVDALLHGSMHACTEKQHMKKSVWDLLARCD